MADFYVSMADFYVYLCLVCSKPSAVRGNDKPVDLDEYHPTPNTTIRLCNECAQKTSALELKSLQMITAGRAELILKKRLNVELRVEVWENGCLIRSSDGPQTAQEQKRGLAPPDFESE